MQKSDTWLLVQIFVYELPHNLFSRLNEHLP